jgi:hypothetical protein
MSATDEAIVIRIPDAFSVVLNKGRVHGIKRGMKFNIYIEGEEIIDPASRKSLGKLKIVKATVTVTDVQENFSIAKHLEKEIPSSVSDIIDTLSAGREVAQKLPVNEGDIKPLYSPKDLKIKVGDKAERVID